MWIMLMQTIASIPETGHPGRVTSMSSGASILSQPLSAACAAMLARQSALGSLGCQVISPRCSVN
jgi:hypothetical protein